MIAQDKLFRMNNKERLWQKYCGFLDLSLPVFVELPAINNRPLHPGE